jgi:hypothetical protein
MNYIEVNMTWFNIISTMHKNKDPSVQNACLKIIYHKFWQTKIGT